MNLDKCVIVTGCAGFIGSHMVDLLLSEGRSVIGVDAFTYAGKAENIKHAYENPNFRMHHQDICNTSFIEDLCNANDVEWIINFAAETHVDNSIKNVGPFLKSNIEGVASLLSVCRSTGVKLLQISTDEVYGSADDVSFDENDKLNPRNPYSASKAAAEHLIVSFHNTYGTAYKMVRMSNNFGPRQHGEKLVPTVVRSLTAGKSVPVYGDGTNIRDWFYVKDCVKMVNTVLQSGKENETYNLTHSNEMQNLLVIRKICEVLEADPSEAIQFVKDRPGHDFKYSISNEKVKKLGIGDPTNFDDALTETINNLRRQV